MRKNVKNIILAIFGVVAILGVGSAFAYNKTCFDPEVQVLKQLKAKGTSDVAELEKLKALPALEATEAKRCAFLKSLTPSDKARIVEEKRVGNEEHLKEVERWREQGLLDPVALPLSDQGIRSIDQILPTSSFRQMNAWQGYIDGSLFLIVSGGDYNNPQKGEVVVLRGGFSGKREVYDAPTETGPLEITSEDNGVLTLKSIAGEYEVYHIDSDTRENIKTPGGAIYLFDIKTRTFQ